VSRLLLTLGPQVLTIRINLYYITILQKTIAIHFKHCFFGALSTTKTLSHINLQQALYGAERKNYNKIKNLHE
jgi:hypothetical protein